jgi:putative mRNA 3-end processing factor
MLEVTEKGLYSPDGDFFIDPIAPVHRALITHGHADHARPGHETVLATPETLAILDVRHGDLAPKIKQPLSYGESLDHFGLRITLHPAGHVLGSAQILLEKEGYRLLITGDFKTKPDPTCPPWQPVKAHRIITEATFGLPIFRHPPPELEIEKLLASVNREPKRAHLVGVYPLGKCQRLIALLRRAGWDRQIYLHGALFPMTRLYEAHGVAMEPLAAATGAKKTEMEGAIVLAPPGALADRWTRRLPDPVVAYASGFMHIRARARQRGVELPLVISDHADWDELLASIESSEATEVSVTHGLADGIVHWARGKNLDARALELTGYEEEEAS